MSKLTPGVLDKLQKRILIVKEEIKNVKEEIKNVKEEIKKFQSLAPCFPISRSSVEYYKNKQIIRL